MLNPIPQDRDTLLRHAHWFLFGGLLLGALSRFAEGFGVISATMAVGLGASAGVFRQWRTDPGLWMLAALFLLLFGSCYGIMLYGELHDLWQGKGNAGCLVWCDFSLGLTILGSHVRILAQIVRLNIKLPKT
jgi:hypothetical protein